MHQWTADDGCTHVFSDRNRPPRTGFGWKSLCDEWQIPIEGTQFELDEDVDKEYAECERCRERAEKRRAEFEADAIAGMRSCLIRTDRYEDGTLVDAHRLCRGLPLHYEIFFEPETVSEDLSEQVETVCDDCWQIYTDRQWASNAEGGELVVECLTGDGRKTYHAASIEAVNTGPEAKLRLVSENGLTEDVPCQRIESIALTQAQRVDY